MIRVTKSVNAVVVFMRIGADKMEGSGVISRFPESRLKKALVGYP